MVAAAFGLAKVTVPGPLTIDQVMVTALGGFGSPSSVTVPARVAAAGKVTVRSGPALTTGAWLTGGAGFTVMATSSLADRALSFPVRRRTYEPDVENVAVVAAAFGLAKVTVPGPLTIDQVMVTALGGFGSPSSVTVPARVAAAGKVTVRSGPALTTGAWLTGGAGFTVMATSSLADRALSFPVRRRTYEPDVENVAVVAAAFGLAKVTVPGPLTIDQVMVTAPGGFGSPSSVTVPARVAAAGKVTVRSGPALTTGAWLTGAPENARIWTSSARNPVYALRMPSSELKAKRSRTVGDERPARRGARSTSADCQLVPPSVRATPPWLLLATKVKAPPLIETWADASS